MQRWSKVVVGAALAVGAVAGCLDWQTPGAASSGPDASEASADVDAHDAQVSNDAGDSSRPDAADAATLFACPPNGDAATPTTTCTLGQAVCCAPGGAASYVCMADASTCGPGDKIACSSAENCPGAYCCWTSNGIADGVAACAASCPPLGKTRIVCTSMKDCPAARPSCTGDGDDGSDTYRVSPLTVCR